jgi:hypothetical protein
MQAPTRPAGASVAKRWYDGGHDDRRHRAGTLGGAVQDCADRLVIIGWMQKIGVFGRVPRASKVEPKKFQRNLHHAGDLVVDAAKFNKQSSSDRESRAFADLADHDDAGI